MATDDFNRANETPLASPWTLLGSSVGDIDLFSNAIRKTAVDGDAFKYYSGAAVTADQYSQVTQNTGTSRPDMGPAVRVGSNLFSGYFLDYFSSHWNKHVNSTFTQLTDNGATYGLTDTLRIEAQGSTLRAFQNGSPTPTPSMTDTSLTTVGNGAGVFAFSSNGNSQLDDWSGGDISLASLSINPDFTQFPKVILRRA